MYCILSTELFKKTYLEIFCNSLISRSISYEFIHTSEGLFIPTLLITSQSLLNVLKWLSRDTTLPAMIPLNYLYEANKAWLKVTLKTKSFQLFQLCSWLKQKSKFETVVSALNINVNINCKKAANL